MVAHLPHSQTLVKHLPHVRHCVDAGMPFGMETVNLWHTVLLEWNCLSFPHHSWDTIIWLQHGRAGYWSSPWICGGEVPLLSAGWVGCTNRSLQRMGVAKSKWRVGGWGGTEVSRESKGGWVRGSGTENASNGNCREKRPRQGICHKEGMEVSRSGGCTERMGWGGQGEGNGRPCTGVSVLGGRVWSHRFWAVHFCGGT